MSLEYIQFLDNEPINNRIVKTDFSKIYHQHGANLNNLDQNVEFSCGENNNYHQCGNSYLEIDITGRNPVANFDNNSEIRLINNPYTHGFNCFKEVSLATTGGVETEHVKFLG